ncbi:MAG: DUF4159 domain-containing protein [Myxococcota bacterium]
MSHRTRRQILAAAAGVAAAAPTEALAFGEEGAFNPRVLLTGTAKWEGKRKGAPGRWALEVVRRTSSPARLKPTTVRADSASLLSEPFAIWTGAKAPEPLTRREIQGLRRFIGLGGVLFVDEQAPEKRLFLAGAKKELARVLPGGSPIAIGQDNVVFRSFYLLPRAYGRKVVNPKLEAIVRGGLPQVLFSSNDLLGALAIEAGGVYPFRVKPSDRLRALRLAVNISMFVLCSNYKDDQVHAPFLMRRRASDGR